MSLSRPSLGRRAGRTEEVAVAPIISQLILQAVLFFGIALAASGAALLFSRSIAGSVMQLRNHAVALGSGEPLNPMVASGPAEIKELAESFDEMAEKLRSREISLREQGEWLRVTLTSIGDGVIATDASGLVTFINPVGAELTGRQLKEALGQPVQSVFKVINEKTREPAEGHRGTSAA